MYFRKTILLFIAALSLQSADAFDFKSFVSTVKAKATEKETVRKTKHLTAGVGLSLVSFCGAWGTLCNIFDFYLAGEDDSSRARYALNVLATGFLTYKAAKAAKNHFCQISNKKVR